MNDQMKMTKCLFEIKLRHCCDFEETIWDKFGMMDNEEIDDCKTGKKKSAKTLMRR